MLRPHDTEDAKFRQARRAAQDGEHIFILIGLQAEFGSKLGGAFGGQQGDGIGHDGDVMARRGGLVKPKISIRTDGARAAPRGRSR